LTNIKHIFFDLDHTLWDFERNSLETLGELFHQFRIADRARREVTSEFFVQRYVMHNERMWAMYRENRISKSRLRSARFEAALRDLGIEDKRFAKEIGEAYLASCPQKTALKPGAMEIVEALNEQYQLHILSNGFHETQLIKLASSELDVFFDEIITSERANAKKPNPRIFEVANQVTSSAPHESIMIGDNIGIDVLGALQMNWQAIHFNDREEESSIELPGPYHEIRALKELGPLLLK